MSETQPRRILHLVIDGYPAAQLAEVLQASPETKVATEIFALSSASAREALDKIFAADTIAVWGKL